MFTMARVSRDTTERYIYSKMLCTRTAPPFFRPAILPPKLVTVDLISKSLSSIDLFGFNTQTHNTVGVLRISYHSSIIDHCRRSKHTYTVTRPVSSMPLKLCTVERFKSSCCTICLRRKRKLCTKFGVCGRQWQKKNSSSFSSAVRSNNSHEDFDISLVHTFKSLQELSKLSDSNVLSAFYPYKQ